jgi:hypothetical protein
MIQNTWRKMLFWFLLPVRWALERVPLLSSPCAVVDGMRLYDTTRAEGPDSPIISVQEALLLVKDFAPRWYRRIAREMPHILIVERHGGTYSRITGSGRLDSSLVQHSSPALIASYVVELAARARIGNALRSYEFNSESLKKVWRRSIKEQLAFASKLPSDQFPEKGALQQHIEALLSSYAA